MKEMPDLERLIAVFADMPCTNRETAAEKADAHACMEKERRSAAGIRRRNWHLQVLERFRREREREKTAGRQARRKRG
jgi:hypothetical protein